MWHLINHNSAVHINRLRNSFHNRTTSPFGIIAALNKQNVIGINGSLPWKHLPQDIAHFVNMTRDKVLIIGRKSFADENPTGSQVEHVRACIVLSNSMDEDALVTLQNKRGGPELKLARSFDEALHIAHELNREDVNVTDTRSIDCWVAGGAGIYREALQHPNLVGVNLTHVDMEINQDLAHFQMANDVTFFPMDVFHKIGFHEVSRSIDDICTFCVYKKNVRGLLNHDC